jgi:fumarate hydratase subunit alpha
LAITYDAVKSLTAQLYEWSLKKIPEDTKLALQQAAETETNEGARKLLAMMM